MLLESIPIADAKPIQTFVRADDVSVGGVLEIDRDAVMPVQAITNLGWNMKQGSRAKGFAVWIEQLQLTIVNRGPNANAENETSGDFILPAQIQISMARRASSVD